MWSTHSYKYASPSDKIFLSLDRYTRLFKFATMNSSRVLIYITEQGKKIKGLIPTINIRVSTEFLFSNVGRLLSANLVLYVDKSLCIWNIHFVILVLLRRQRECTTQLSKSLSFLNINIKLHGNVFNFWLILNALFVRFV